MQATANPRVVKNCNVRSRPAWHDDVGPPWHQVISGGGSTPGPLDVGRKSGPWTKRPSRAATVKGPPTATSSAPSATATGGRTGRAPPRGCQSQTVDGTLG